MLKNMRYNMMKDCVDKENLTIYDIFQHVDYFLDFNAEIDLTN